MQLWTHSDKCLELSESRLFILSGQLDVTWALWTKRRSHMFAGLQQGAVRTLRFGLLRSVRLTETLRSVFVTDPFHMQMLRVWFALDQHSTWGRLRALEGLFRCNCLSGLIVPGFSCFQKHLRVDQSIWCTFQVCVLTADGLSSNCLFMGFYS